MIRNDHRVIAFDRFVGDGGGQVDCEQDGIGFADLRVVGRFEEEAGVVEGRVGEAFWVELAHGFDDGAGEG